MSRLTQQQKQEILDRYDPDDIIEILGMTTVILVEILEVYISRNLRKFDLDTYDSETEEEEPEDY
jgi:hypothetical protein